MKKRLIKINKKLNNNIFLKTELTYNNNFLKIYNNKLLDQKIIIKLNYFSLLKELTTNGSFWLQPVLNKINNFEKGLKNGWFVVVELEGLGYKISSYKFNNKNFLKLDLGFSHGISIEVPGDIDVVILNKEIIIKSFNKDSIGVFARKLYMLKMNKKPKNAGFRIIGMKDIINK